MDKSTETSERKPRVLKWALVVSIAIVLNLFLTYAVRLVYHEPEYENFCQERQVMRQLNTEEACLQVGGQWNENFQEKVSAPSPEVAGYCDQDFTCRKDFEDARKVYNRNVFVVFVVAGIAALGGSLFLTAAEAISIGLSFGGVLALIIGTLRYWSGMEDLLRVAILGLALAALLWLGYKKFKD